MNINLLNKDTYQKKILPMKDVKRRILYNPKYKFYKISMCIAGMNILQELKETLLKNVMDNCKYPGIEFVVLNYNSNDELDKYIYKNLNEYIEKGILNYYYTPDTNQWSESVAKNLAHKIAKGEILCNLNGYNFTGENYANLINYIFNEYGEDIVLQFFKNYDDGNFGKICISRNNFYRLGGYNENPSAEGYEDFDLILRAKALGLNHLNCSKVPKYLNTLENDEDRRKILNKKYWDKHKLYNSAKSITNIRKGILSANTGGFGIGYRIYKNFSSNYFLT